MKDSLFARYELPLLLSTAFLVSTITLMMSYLPPSLKEYRVNTRASKQLISRYTFSHEDTQTTETLRKALDMRLPLSYQLLDNSLRESQRLLLEWIAAATNENIQNFQNYLKTQHATYSESIEKFILRDRFLIARYENRLLFTLSFLYENYLFVRTLKPTTNTFVYLISPTETKTFPVSRIILTPPDKSFLLETIQKLFHSKDELLNEAMAEILLSVLQPSAELDETTREQSIQAALEQELPRNIIRKGDILISQGSIVTPLDMEKLSAYRKFTEKVFTQQFPILLFLMLVTFLLFLYRYKDEESLIKNKNYTIIVAIFYMLNHIFLWYSHLSHNTFLIPPFLNMPFAILTLTLPVLLNHQKISFVVLINFAIYSLFYPLTDIVTFSNLMTLALFALYTSSKKRKSFTKRYDFLILGVFIIIIQVIFTLLYEWFYHVSVPLQNWFFLLVFCAGNALISAIVAFGLLPLFEYLFNIPTYFRLIELSSPSTSPLLHELSEKAKGTYLHSQTLAEMCEAAAREIGADPLLTRVGAYYHDVGKLQKPEFFIENQDKDNPHDEIKPSLSISIIKSHVKYGIEFAKKYRLPQEIINFIEEHHGTTSISYFYHQALSLYGEETINSSDYEYPGPKPRSLETAILMLADGIEATARAYAQREKKLSMHTLEDIIDDIIEQRLQSGQFDECPITLLQIRQIRDVFLEYLSAHYHKRLDYNRR